MSKWLKWKVWNDQLSLLVILLIPSLWVANHWLILPGEVIGATIVAWTLVLQYYFRRSPPDIPPTP